MIFTLLLAVTFSRPLERVSTMDPAFSQTVYDSRAVQLVYATPLEVDYYARPYRLTAGLCELPEVSADGKRYIFKLRTPAVKAAWLVRSLERLRDKTLVSPNGWIVKDVDTVTALDDQTVEIKLKRRVHYFPWLMAMSPAAVRGENDEPTGAYRLVKWRKNHEMVFKIAQGDRGVRGFDEVRYLVIDDVTTQFLMFLKGELDFLGEISRDNLDSILGSDGTLSPELEARGIRLHTLTSMDVMHIGFNMRDPVLGKNRKLRQALTSAFDTPAWEKFYLKRIIAADGPVPPGVEGRLESPSPYPFDLERARRLIAEAGYPGGIDPKTGRRLVLTLAIGRASQASREQGELVASFFEKIGVKLELDFMTWDAFINAVSEGRTQMSSMGWVGDYPDAQNFLQLFYSKNASPGPNHTAYANADFDREFEAALDAADAEERNRHWHKCQEIVREDCPWIFTHYNRSFSLTGPRVGNYIPSVFPYGDEQHYLLNK